MSKSYIIFVAGFGAICQEVIQSYRLHWKKIANHAVIFLFISTAHIFFPVNSYAGPRSLIIDGISEGIERAFKPRPQILKPVSEIVDADTINKQLVRDQIYEHLIRDKINPKKRSIGGNQTPIGIDVLGEDIGRAIPKNSKYNRPFKFSKKTGRNWEDLGWDIGDFRYVNSNLNLFMPFYGEKIFDPAYWTKVVEQRCETSVLFRINSFR